MTDTWMTLDKIKDKLFMTTGGLVMVLLEIKWTCRKLDQNLEKIRKSATARIHQRINQEINNAIDELKNVRKSYQPHLDASLVERAGEIHYF